MVHFIQAYLSNVQILPIRSKEEYLNGSGPSINYSSNKLKEDEYFLQDSGALYLSVSQFKDPSYRQTENQFQIFPNPNDAGFDLFAAIFYLLSRAEEYLPFKPDQHGRFPAVESFLYKHHLLSKPIIDEWVFQFIKELEVHFRIAIKIQRTDPAWSIGWDIDQFYKHQYKPLWKQFAGSIRDLLNGHVQSFLERLKIYSRFKLDPFDTIEILRRLQIPKDQLNIFILSGGNSAFDQNHSLGLKPVMNTLKSLKELGQISLHPSYFCLEHESLVAREKKNLEIHTAISINQSRFHFLRFRIPQSYRNLIQNQILTDYSLTYADHFGFRAGTCRPFYWYDLEAECETQLKLISPLAMDRSFLDYLKWDPEQSKQIIGKLFQQVQFYGGHFHLIWHNSSFDFEGEWKHWESTFESLIDYFKNSILRT